MLCEVCNTKKLRKEFPSKSITANCNHAPLHCLRCVTKHVEQHNSCSKCNEKVTEDSPLYRKYVSMLNHMFPPLETTDVSDDEEEEADNIEFLSADIDVTIRVVTLGGDVKEIQFSPSMKVRDFKNLVERNFGVDPGKQRLLFNEKELETIAESYRPMTLQDYGVQSHNTLLLMKVLQKIPDDFDHVIFDFSYGFPSYGRDYLDASALLYSGNDFDQYVDFRTRPSRFSQIYRAIEHSGYAGGLDPDRGSQVINVYLKKMPPSIDKIFFTLSSWNSRSISSFDTPSLHFYDARYPDTQLCSDRMSHVIHRQAIIMCCLHRERRQWRVISLGIGSSGNTKRENYCDLESAIDNIIARGLNR